VIENTAYDWLMSDFIVQLLTVLNPFRKEDPFTELDCAVLVALAEDGQVRLDPIAGRSKKITIVGDGRVNLETEKIGFQWATKPRSGIGLSATAITNSFIRVSGSLTDPDLDLKPLDAVVSTGAAVATAGLSLLARGFYDRVTAEKKVCKNAIKRAERVVGLAEARKQDKASSDAQASPPR
jgi:hypothetical protein